MKRHLIFLTNQGPNILAFGALSGLVWPGLADLAAPAMPVSIFLLVWISLLRVEGAFHQLPARPLTAIVLPLLLMVPCPLLVGYAAQLVGFAPDTVLALVLATAAPPSIGNAAVARMLGLDGGLPLAATMAAMVLAPLTVPLAAILYGGPAIDPVALAVKLLVLVGAAAGLALPLRIHAASAIARHGTWLDLILLLALLVFALSAMAGLQAWLLAQPLVAMGQIALAFTVNLGLQGLGALLLPGSLATRAGGALLFGNRNVGLVWSALGSAVPPTAALYFAATQLPIYTLPRLLQFILARHRGSHRDHRSGGPHA